MNRPRALPTPNIPRTAQHLHFSSTLSQSSTILPGGTHVHAAPSPARPGASEPLLADCLSALGPVPAAEPSRSPLAPFSLPCAS
eukprot:2161062-Prymnesium_polylepis.1